MQECKRLLYKQQQQPPTKKQQQKTTTNPQTNKKQPHMQNSQNENIFVCIIHKINKV